MNSIPTVCPNLTISGYNLLIMQWPTCILVLQSVLACPPVSTGKSGVLMINVRAGSRRLGGKYLPNGNIKYTDTDSLTILIRGLFSLEMQVFIPSKND